MRDTQTERDYLSLFSPHFHRLTEHGDEVRGCCPFHRDTNPSWSGNRRTGQWICFACSAKGNAKQFAERLGIEFTDEQKPKKSQDPWKESTIVTTYDYCDELGQLRYQAVRFDPKNFRPRVPDGKGGWITRRDCMDGIERVLFDLPSLPAATTVYVTEGEEDVLALQKQGLTATTVMQGAYAKLTPELFKPLAGKHVVILPDKDKAGKEFGQRILDMVSPIASRVQVIDLPKLPAKEDVRWWLNNGHTIEELQGLVAQAPILGGLRTAVLTRLSDVQLAKLNWFWKDRIPLGKLTVLDGDPGLGKSLVSLDLSARGSTARPMPDGTTSDLSEPAGVVLLSAEDDPADTIRPRLEAAEADISRIVLLSAIRQGDTERLPTLLDLEGIRDAIQQANAKLVVIDPLMAYLPEKVDSHKDQAIRRVLALLAKLAAETGVAVLVVRHLNKTNSGKAIYRGGGSIGIVGAARSALLVAKDPEDEERRILAATKSNLAKPVPSLVYRIEATENGVPQIRWLGESQHTADNLVVQPLAGEEQSALDEAKAFLTDLLVDGPQEVKDIQREARSAGISEATLRRAKTTLRVIARKQGNFRAPEQKWVWLLPEGAQPPFEDAQTREHERLQINSEKNSRNYTNLSEGAQESKCERLQQPNGHLQEGVEVF